MMVQCLGSGDAFGSGGRLQTAFYIRTKGMGILLDAGASVLIALKKQKLSAADIDVIIISHLHGDHFGGLPFILCEIIAVGKRSKPLTIIGPDGTEARTKQLLEGLFPGVTVKPDTPVKFLHYVTRELLEFQDLAITAFPALHAAATHPHSIRLQLEDRIVAFSGDTEWSDELIKVSMNADLFICEASTWNSPVKEHLSIKALAAQLHRIQAKRIVVTHLGEEALSHQDDIPFTVAQDGMILMEK